MKYSHKDLILVFIAFFQISFLLFWAQKFKDFNGVANLVSFLVSLLLFYFNPIVITHNFLHCPFFKNKNLNKLFSILNTMGTGIPVTLYKHHHLIHHKYNNSMNDPSSTLLFGKNGNQEGWISYCGLSLFRDGVSEAFKHTVKRNENTQLILEFISITFFIVMTCYINWQWFIFCYIPLFYFGYFLAHLENYFEHFHATDFDNRFANSVSYYQPLYNKLMFNEGFHQAHHISPQVHWSKRPLIDKDNKDQLILKNSYIAKFPPLLGFLER